MSDIDAVRVAVRIRPLVKIESDRGCQSIVEKVSNEPQIIFKNNGSFTFNFVYEPEAKQEFIYIESVQMMIKKLFKGYNVTILAYGQTGSGKTHTMGTAFDGNFNDDTGVIPRAVHDIFELIREMAEYNFTVTCSFMELYQEQLYDLLSTAPRDQSVVDIREDGQKGIVIPGLTEQPVTSAQETTDCLIKGSRGRAVGATAMNAQSSRSHAIFTINVQMMKAGDSNTFTSSKFHLVDLAGSERSKKTKATGDRFKEGVKINQGLLALGNVISALGSLQGNGFIGYRDSKLTRLLQDSLGGNSMTLMIACVSPADYNLDETLSTLRYADRARKIKNKPIVNQDPKAAEINRLNGIIEKLRLELLSKDGGGGAGVGGGGGVGMMASSAEDIKNMQLVIETLNDKNRRLQLQLQGALCDVGQAELRAHLAESAHEELYNKLIQVNEKMKLINKDATADNEEQNKSGADDERAKTFVEITELVEQVVGVLEKNNNELIDTKKSMSEMGSTLSLVDNEGSMPTDVQRKIDDYNRKQIDLNKELKELDKELGLKEALHQQCTANLTHIDIYGNQTLSEELVKEREEKIRFLELEKDELLAQVKSYKNNNTCKISEQRRLRLQTLEQDLGNLRKMVKQQANILKMREKDGEKVVNMNKEIQEMKRKRVALVRAMRAESDNFRKWKENRDRELRQLKEKDRKRQNEMIRMESMHSKKENVLKRRVEEQTAAYKRLKEQFEKQKQAAQARRKKNETPGKVEQVIQWIDEEIEVMSAVVDAKLSIEQLMEHRAALTSRLQEIRDSSTDDATADTSRIDNEIQNQNAQINDLQNRIMTSDVEAKIKAVIDGLQSMPEARTAVKHLFGVLNEMRKEYATKDFKLRDLKLSGETAEMRIVELTRELEEKDAAHKDQTSKIEKNYEEKVTLLLRELNTPKMDGDTIEMTESQKIHQEQLDKLESMRDELEQWKVLYAELEEQLKSKKPRMKGRIGKIIKEEKIDEQQNDSDDVEDIEEDDELILGSGDDDLNDPDFRGTPLKLRNDYSRATKRSSDGNVRCGCKGNCKTKQCTCRKNSQNCGENCRCPDSCLNKYDSHSDGDSSSKINGSLDGSNHNINETVVLDKTASQVSILTETMIEESVTPSYPKKRRPFF